MALLKKGSKNLSKLGVTSAIIVPDPPVNCEKEDVVPSIYVEPCKYAVLERGAIVTKKKAPASLD